MAKKVQAKEISRRDFLKSSAIALVIGMHLPAGGAAKALAGNGGEPLTANAFIRIAADNTVTVLIKHGEFGQGTFTGLATLAAEEMDADWSQIRAEHAPANAELYANTFWGQMQGTGGSTSLANSYLVMRQAGAKARQLLVNAAAHQWNAPSESVTVSRGIVHHAGSGRSANFGELVEIASNLPVPTAEPTLKSAEQFTLIGTDLPKLDTAGKSSGQALYTQDLFMDGMVVAVVARPPAFGASVKSYNDSEARKVRGVVDVKQVPSGIAVYADSTYNAIKGRKALQVEWDYQNAETRDSATLFEEYRKELTTGYGLQAAAIGDADRLVDHANKIEAEFRFPYLAHAPMEPLDAVMLHKDGKVTAWYGCQIQTADQLAIASVFGIGPEHVDIRTQFAGGSFGRRSDQYSSLAVEAALLTQAFGEGVPVKLVWTREDDIQGGRYRPMSVHRMTGAIDDNGKLLGWKHSIATQSIFGGTPYAGAVYPSGIDPSSVEGAAGQPYALPNLDVRQHTMTVGVPVLWWRSVGHTHNSYAVETFVDALLEKSGQDPVKGRLALLQQLPREANVIRAVVALAEKSGKAPQGRARGLAMVKSFGSYVAQIAEVSRASNGMPRVHRVWCAVDCGIAVNANVIKAQMEGGIGFGLDAILHGEITLGEKGHVNQSNFHDYNVMRINEMPEVEVEVVKSTENPSGVGEVAVPPIGPAVANAWRRLTGQYVTTLPFSKGVKIS